MYTTRLLDGINDVMPRRHQLVLGAIVAFIALASIAGSIASRRPQSVAAPQTPIILIATPTPYSASAMGLAKQAAPLAMRSAPTAAPRPLPTAAPVPTVPLLAEQIAAKPGPRRVGEKPSNKPGPRRVHERPSDKAGPGGRDE